MPKKITDKINIDQLAKLLGLASFDSIEDLNADYIGQIRVAAEREADNEGDDFEAAGEKAEDEARTDLFNNWYDAVFSAGETLFELHGLELMPVRARRRRHDPRSYELKIVPTRSWADAADRIRETINGVGRFYFSDLREFLRSGPYTAREAVLSHYGYVTQHPDVYGGPNAQWLYQRAWRS